MINEVASIAPERAPSGTGLNKSMGMNEFLQLLVTQLQNQDPLEPISNEDFIAQLATFSSLEQLVNINGTMTELSMLQSSINNSQAVNLIGRQIVVVGNQLELSEGKASHASFSLNSPAETVTVEIKNGNGEVVRTIELGYKGAGRVDVDWDGRDNSGEMLEDGNYTFSISAVGKDETIINPKLFCEAYVYVYLVSGEQRYMLSDVIEVRE